MVPDTTPHQIVKPWYDGELGRLWRECSCGNWVASGNTPGQVNDRFELHVEKERIIADDSHLYTYDMPDQ